MRIRADFATREVVRPEDYDWVASPSAGVNRMMLDRIGDEVARATTIVRFEAGSYFDAHTHGGGEEYLVLDGVFSDESGDYPAGTYVRNPIGTRHKPHTDPGCTILVKLHQFAKDDTHQFHVETGDAEFATRPDGVEVLELHTHGSERVRVERWPAGARPARHLHEGGEEIYVLDGAFEDEFGAYPSGTWLRQPDGSSHTAWSEGGCTLWVKSGHLANR